MEREHTAIGDVLFFEFIKPTFGLEGGAEFEAAMGIAPEDMETTWALIDADHSTAKEIYTRDVCMQLAKVFNTTVEFWENLRDK